MHYNYASVLNASRLSHRKRHKSEFPPTKSSAFPQLRRAGTARRGAGGQPKPAQRRSPPGAARQLPGGSVPAERGHGTGRAPLTPRRRDQPRTRQLGTPGPLLLRGAGEHRARAVKAPRSGGCRRGHPELRATGTLRRRPGAPRGGRPKLRSRQVSSPHPASPAAPRPTCHRSRSRRSGC